MKKPLKKVVHGQPSWRLASKKVEVFVTEEGGHLGPITFDRQKRKIQPMSVAPWAEEKLPPGMPPLISSLRGDFFCMPFGGNGTPFNGEKHPPHGETANAKWTCDGEERLDGIASGLFLSMNTKARKASVQKLIAVNDKENAVYCAHVICNARGPMDLGHHAMVKFPDYPGSGIISTSPIKLGQVYPSPFEKAEEKGYSQLKPGAVFKSIERVPTVFGTYADLSRYPARRGWEDLVMMVSDIPKCPRLGKEPFAWTAVSFPKERYVWFALKDPRVLRSTVFWISNGGRHYPPWNSRHVNVMGLEEVTSYFHEGLAESAKKNHLSAKGIPTCVQLRPGQPLFVKYIMSVALTPKGFDRVVSIEARAKTVVLKSASGLRVEVPLCVCFLHAMP